MRNDRGYAVIGMTGAGKDSTGSETNRAKQERIDEGKRWQHRRREPTALSTKRNSSDVDKGNGGDVDER